MKKFALLVGLSALLCGCAGPKFSAPKYHSRDYGLERVTVTTSKKMYVCPVIDRLGEDNRQIIDPKFSVSAYLTDALKQELTAVGVGAADTPFAIGPSFDAARQTIIAKANPQENAAYVVCEARWFGPGKVTVDTKLYSPSGTVAFEKRGICIMLLVGASSDEITKMAWRQILADPDFQKALL